MEISAYEKLELALTLAASTQGETGNYDKDILIDLTTGNFKLYGLENCLKNLKNQYLSDFKLRLYTEMYNSLDTCIKMSSKKDGDECTSVYHFPEEDIYIQFTGEDTSYDGGGFASMKQVFPKKTTITTFE